MANRWPPDTALCVACPHPEHGDRECGRMWDVNNRCACTEGRPGYILAMRAQALDAVQKLIHPGGPWPEEVPVPTPELWRQIIEAAFPPPPMAG